MCHSHLCSGQRNHGCQGRCDHSYPAEAAIEGIGQVTRKCINGTSSWRIIEFIQTFLNDGELCELECDGMRCCMKLDNWVAPCCTWRAEPILLCPRRFRSYREDMIFDRTYPLSSSMMSRVLPACDSVQSSSFSRRCPHWREVREGFESISQSANESLNQCEPVSAVSQVQQAKVGRHLDFTMQTVSNWVDSGIMQRVWKEVPKTNVKECVLQQFATFYNHQ